jgi:hypothetical protein
LFFTQGNASTYTYRTWEAIFVPVPIARISSTHLFCVYDAELCALFNSADKKGRVPPGDFEGVFLGVHWKYDNYIDAPD